MYRLLKMSKNFAIPISYIYIYIYIYKLVKKTHSIVGNYFKDKEIL